MQEVHHQQLQGLPVPQFPLHPQHPIHLTELQVHLQVVPGCLVHHQVLVLEQEDQLGVEGQVEELDLVALGVH